jgi:hypothetical protein
LNSATVSLRVVRFKKRNEMHWPDFFIYLFCVTLPGTDGGEF